MTVKPGSAQRRLARFRYSAVAAYSQTAVPLWPPDKGRFHTLCWTSPTLGKGMRRFPALPRHPYSKHASAARRHWPPALPQCRPAALLRRPGRQLRCAAPLARSGCRRITAYPKLGRESISENLGLPHIDIRYSLPVYLRDFAAMTWSGWQGVTGCGGSWRSSVSLSACWLSSMPQPRWTSSRYHPAIDCRHWKVSE